MAKTTILHAADLHLGGPVASPDEHVRAIADKARDETLKRLVALSCERGAHLVFLAGDVFHAPNPPISALWALQRACEAWTAQGARVFIAPGNHDPWMAGSVWDDWRPPVGVHVFRPEPQGIALPELGLWVAGAAHDSPHVEEDLAVRLPAPPPGLTGAAVLHADLPSSRLSDAHKPYAPTRLERLAAAPFALWALGHWHQAQKLSEHPLIIMPGTPQGAHLKESGPCGAYVIEIEEGAARAEFMPLAPLVFFDLALDGLEGMADPTALVAGVRGHNQSFYCGRDFAVCLRLLLSGPSPLWRYFSGQEEGASEAADDLQSALGVQGLVLNTESLRPPLDLTEMAARPHVLGRLLKLIAQAGEDDGFLASLAGELGPNLHPAMRKAEEAERVRWLRDLLPNLRALALSELLAEPPGNGEEGGHVD